MEDLIKKISKKTDKYENGVIIQGDCIDVMREIQENTVQTCITDPPWGVGYQSRRKKFSDVKIVNDKLEEYKSMMEVFAKEVFRILKKSGSVYVFPGCGVIKMLEGNTLHWNTWFIMDIFHKAGFVPMRILFWDKITPGMSFRYRGVYEFILYFVKPGKSKFPGEGYYSYDHIMLAEENIKGEGHILDSEVFRYQRLHGANKVHTAEKPVRLYESFILDSTEEGDLVIDPCAGSGPIIDACKNTGRRYIAIDIDEGHVSGMREREKQVSIFEKAPRSKKLVQVDIENISSLQSDKMKEEVNKDMDSVRDMLSGGCDDIEDQDVDIE